MSALDDSHSAEIAGESIPPTFPTVIEFWGTEKTMSKQLGLKQEKVLHGGQEYEYYSKIRPGDEITVYSHVEDVYSKGSMTFFIIKKEFVNQNGETVVVGRSTIIER